MKIDRPISDGYNEIVCHYLDVEAEDKHFNVFEIDGVAKRISVEQSINKTDAYDLMYAAVDEKCDNYRTPIYMVLLPYQ